jgi:hypothetical protein
MVRSARNLGPRRAGAQPPVNAVEHLAIVERTTPRGLFGSIGSMIEQRQRI